MLYACFLNLNSKISTDVLSHFPDEGTWMEHKPPHPRKWLNGSLNPRGLASKNSSPCCYTDAQVVGMATIILVAVTGPRCRQAQSVGQVTLSQLYFWGNSWGEAPCGGTSGSRPSAGGLSAYSNSERVGPSTSSVPTKIKCCWSVRMTSVCLQRSVGRT